MRSVWIILLVIVAGTLAIALGFSARSTLHVISERTVTSNLLDPILLDKFYKLNTVIDLTCGNAATI